MCAVRGGLRTSAALLLLQHIPVELQHPVGILQPQLPGLAHIEAAFTGILEENLYQSPVVIGLGERRIQFDGLRIVLQRFRDPSRAAEQVRPVIIDIGKFGEEPGGLVQVGDRIVVIIGPRRVAFKLAGRIDEIKSTISLCVVLRLMYRNGLDGSRSMAAV